MDAFVEVVNPDGTQERFPIEGAQCTLGKSGSAQVSIPTARELELEHLLIAPRGKEGCWVSTSQGALTPTLYKGKPFENGIVPWGAEFSIGRLLIRVTNKRGASKGGEPTVNPVLLVVAGVVLVGAAYMYLSKESSTLPSAEGLEPPDIFTAEPAECPTAGDTTENAESAEYRAHSRGDRIGYDLRDGVSAVMLYDQAAACYDQLENAEKTREMRDERDQMKEAVNAEYAARRLRLHHALQTEDWENAVIETRALARLVSYIDGENEYVVWLDRSGRIVQARWDKERERRD